MKIKWNNPIKLGNFYKTILTLVSGATIAQIIPIAITPILTRIYTPEDFGLLALYLGIANIVANIATGRYELAILLPKKISESKSVVLLSIIITFSIGFLFFIITILFSKKLALLFGNEQLSTWLYFIPVSIILNGLHQSYYYWLNRNIKYKQMAFSKILQTGTNSLFAIVFQMFSMGLLFAQILGRLVSTLYLLFFSWRKIPVKFLTTKKRLKSVALKYKEFPLYDIPTALISSSNQNIPNILFNSFFSNLTGGFYYLAIKIIGLPISLISSAFLDVFKQQASEEYSKRGNAKETYVKTFKTLFLLSIIPFSIFFYYAEDIFMILFGKEWVISGKFAKILIPMVFLRFLASPLSFMFYIAKKQIYNLIGQTIILVLLLSSFIVGNYYNSEYITLYMISVGFSLFYIFYIIISYRLAINK